MGWTTNRRDRVGYVVGGGGRRFERAHVVAHASDVVWRVLGAATLVLAVYLFLTAIGTWWWLASWPLALVGLSGIVEGGR